MIKFSHTHADGKVCVRTNTVYRYSEMLCLWLGEEPLPPNVDLNELVYAGFRPYTNQWYVYASDGRELATMRKEFFEKQFRSCVIAVIEEAKDC